MSIAVAALPSAAQAAGFEKSVLWSGKYSGVAGATASNVVGAEALAFNPAGIAAKKDGQEVAANLSIVQSQFKGPIGAANQQSSGDTTYVSPFSLLYAMNLNDQWAVGVGAYTAGGAKAEYGGVTFPMTAGTNAIGGASVKTDLAINEVSFGGSWRPMDKLRLGAAWRIAFVNADFMMAQPAAANNAAVLVTEFSNIRDTQWNGYRLGAQWVEDTWAIGLAYRSEMIFTASADVNGRAGVGASTVTNTTPTSAQVSTALPQQISLGGHWDIDPGAWRAYLEYDFTNYSRVDAININGTFTNAGIGASNKTIPSVRMNWLDQHNIRLAGEWMNAVAPVRFGYVYTTQVTSSDYARASFAPPAVAHTLTLGSGLEFLGGKMRADGGLDYTFSSGSAVANANDISVIAGDYAVNALSVHLGASYSF